MSESPEVVAVMADLAEDTQPLVERDSSRTTTLITEHEVHFGTAAAVSLPRKTVGSRLTGAVRRLFVSSTADGRPPRRHYPRHYGYIEDSRMAREMDRL